jgi:hypothetical protein
VSQQVAFRFSAPHTAVSCDDFGKLGIHRIVLAQFGQIVNGDQGNVQFVILRKIKKSNFAIKN